MIAENVDARVESIAIKVHSSEAAGRILHTLLLRMTAGDKIGLGVAWTLASRHRMAAVAALIRELSPNVVGHSINDPEATWDRVYGRMASMGRQGTPMMALSVLDMALWDLLAQHRELPMHKMLGLEAFEVPVYEAGLFAELTPTEVLRHVGSKLAAGVRALKLSVGGHSLLDEATLVERVRAECGAEIELILDAAGRFSRVEAAEYAETVRPYQITWLEDPVDQDDLVGFKEVRSATSVRLAGGQFISHPEALRQYVGAFPIDVIMADAARIGGVTGWRRAMAMVADSPSFRISGLTLPHIHLPLLLGAKEKAFVEYVDWWANLLGPIEISGGLARPSKAPGWGIELRRNWSSLDDL